MFQDLLGETGYKISKKKKGHKIKHCTEEKIKWGGMDMWKELANMDG